ncbi:MAG TPA: NUDIX domain-containing protein [Candidatus Saccharimonadales bacterium]|nr:NUDIX domain-containing protein [Candidatus Saccharimonadales bacterium]
MVHIPIRGICQVGVDLEEESLEDAVRREIKEETGLEVDSMTRVGFDEDYEPDKKGVNTHYVFLAYKVTPTTIDVKASDDIVDLKWFDKSELKDIALTRPSVKLFKELHYA